MKNLRKNKSGISLIILVITIIVMIILATAIILSLSNSGIISKANEAKRKNDEAALAEKKNMDEIDDMLNGKELIYNKPSYSVKLTLWVFEHGTAGTDYSKGICMYSFTKDAYKAGEKFGLEWGSIENVKSRSFPDSFEYSGIIGDMYGNLSSTNHVDGFDGYTVTAIAQQIPKGTTADYVIDADRVDLTCIGYLNKEELKTQFYMVSFDNEHSNEDNGLFLQPSDAWTGVSLNYENINNKHYRLRHVNYYPSAFDITKSKCNMFISKDTIKNWNDNSKLDDVVLYRNCRIDWITDKEDYLPNIVDKRLGEGSSDTLINKWYTEIFDKKSGQLLKSTLPIAINTASSLGSVMSGYHMDLTIPQNKDKVYTMDNIAIYIGGNYEINYAKKYVTVTDSEIKINIPSVEDDLAIFMISDENFN